MHQLQLLQSYLQPTLLPHLLQLRQLRLHSAQPPLSLLSHQPRNTALPRNLQANLLQCPLVRQLIMWNHGDKLHLTRRDTDRVDCVKITVQIMVLVSLIITATVLLDLTVSLNGLDLTVHCAPAQKILLGLARYKMQITSLLGLNALIRALATASLVSVLVFQDMKALPVNVQFAPTTATIAELAGQKNILLTRLVEFIRPLGTP